MVPSDFHQLYFCNIICKKSTLVIVLFIIYLVFSKHIAMKIYGQSCATMCMYETAYDFEQGNAMQ
jgi:hypothetical protein